MASTSKETLLGKKVFMLERRLALVERFVELRFCETFRDFTIRNSDRKNPGAGDTKGGNDTTRGYSDDDNNDSFYGDDFQEESGPTTSTKRLSRSTRQKNELTKNRAGPCSSSSKKNGDNPAMKNCVIRIVRSESLNSKKSSSATAAKEDREQGKDHSSSQYGTRRQTRLAKQVKVEVDEENVEADEYGGEMELEDDGGNEGNGEDNYFSFPSEQNTTHENENNGGLEGDRENIEEDFEPNDTYEEVESESGSDLDEESEKRSKRKRKSTAKSVQRKFYASEINRKRTRKRNYNASLAELSQETKIVSSDTSREECPICKRHYKKELIQQHINSHMRERTLQCPHCDKRYYGTNELRTHVKITHDREKYFPKCRHCGDAIVRKLILHEKYCVKKALKEGQIVDENLLEDVKKQCALNGLEFSLDDLETSFPPGVDPTEKLECPHCKKYYQRRLFDRHVKTHSMKRNWKCSKCPKAYIHKHDLIRHMIVTHEASLECEICRKTFKTRSDLCNHTKKCKKIAKKKSNHSPNDSEDEEVATRQTTQIADDENEEVDVEEDNNTKESEDGNGNLATEPVEDEEIIA